MSRSYNIQAPPSKGRFTLDYKAELNDEQYAAVSSKPGPALVIAGAGSGKTRTLTYRVAYLIEKGIEPKNILLLTFTGQHFICQELIKNSFPKRTLENG